LTVILNEFEAAANGDLPAKPRVAVIRDGWVSPADIAGEYGNYGRAMGLVDDEGAAAIDAAADALVSAVQDEQWIESLPLFERMLYTVGNKSDGVNVYYVLDPVPFFFFTEEPGTSSTMISECTSKMSLLVGS
jgi:hypothetical protein